MKTHLIFFVSLFLLAACNTTPADLSDTNGDNSQQEVAMLPEGAKVHIVYFHGKQRCKACVTIQEVAAATVAEAFGDNPDVMFIEIDFSDRKNDALAEKYEIAWSSLLIIAGDRHTDLTDEAFATAVRTPEVLKASITEKTNDYLENI